MRGSTGVLVLAAAALLCQRPAAAQEAAVRDPAATGARLDVIRLNFADARVVAAALGALRPPDLRGAVAFVPNNQLITLTSPGGVSPNGFVTGAFGNPFNFNGRFGQRQRGARPAARPEGENGAAEQGAPPPLAQDAPVARDVPAPQAVR
jgi:hypothetical protein